MKKKHKKTLIVSTILISLIVLIFVSANYLTTQQVVGAEPPQGVSLNYPVCIDDEYICTNGAIWNGERTTLFQAYVFLCDIDNIVRCPREVSDGMFSGGCALNYANGNPSEGACFGGSSGSDPVIPTCTEDYMRCGMEATENPSGDIYKCINNEWELYLENDGSQVCEETSVFNAQFETDYWYCIGGNSASGIFLLDENSAQSRNDCYETRAEALSNIGVCCHDPNDNTYIWRYGGYYDACRSDELPRTGTSVDEAWCEAKQLDEGSGCLGSNCDEYCLIDKWWGATDPYGNYPCLIKNPLGLWYFWTILTALILGVIIFIYRKILLNPQVIGIAIGITALVGFLSYLNFEGFNFGFFSIGG